MKAKLNSIIKIAVVVLFLCPAALFAQSGTYIIKGKMGNFNAPAMMILNYRSEEGKDIQDTCTLVNGRFELKGQVTNPVNMVYLRLQRYKEDRDNSIRDWWLEPGTMVINGTDSLKTAKVTGSKLTAAHRKLNTLLAPYLEKKWAIERSRSKNAMSDSQYAQLQKEIKVERLGIIKKFILSNPNSLISLWQLWRVYGPVKYSHKIGMEEVEPMFKGFSAAVRNSKLGKEYKAQLETWKKVGVGTIAPDFTLYDQEGKAVKLSDFKGKYILVDFWASWCYPCRVENPNLVKQYELYKDKNFTILGVSLDVEKDWDKWRKAITDDGMTWPQVVGKVQDNEARLNFYVQGIPDNFLIRPDGVIVAKGLRGEELNEKLKEVLSK